MSEREPVRHRNAEIVESVVKGEDYVGGHGVIVDDSAEVWIALSLVTGGEGEADGIGPFLTCGFPGMGGNAVHVKTGGKVRIAGRGYDLDDTGVFLEGGNGGNGDTCECDGIGGYVPPQVHSLSRKPLSIAFEEIAEGKVVVDSGE